MITRRSLSNQAALLAILVVSGCEAAQAQGFIKKDQNLPNASSFYMARQQWQVIDNSPIINGQPGGPGGPSGNVAPPPGAGLPRAGFQSYSPPAAPQLSTSLPKVNNGVPPKLPPARAPRQMPSGAGAKGRAGKLPAMYAKPASTPTPPAVQAYAPYKGYSPGAAAAGGPAMNSQSNVKGSVLHWARARHSAGGY